jgi:hypothetical protein
MTENEQLLLGAAVVAGAVAIAARDPLPRLILQDYAAIPLPADWPEILRAGRFHALSVKIGYGSTIKDKPSVGTKLDAAQAAGLDRHGSWWVVSRTKADAVRDGAIMAQACARYGCTALHLNAEKSFWGNREANSGGPNESVPERFDLLIAALRAAAPNVQLYWNGYYSSTFTDASGAKRQGIGPEHMSRIDVFEPMIYVWDYTTTATDKKAHEKQWARWRKIARKFPGVPMSPMIFQGNWNGKAWLGTNNPAHGLPGLPGLVAKIRPEGVSFWRWASTKHPEYGDQLSQATRAAPAMRDLGPMLHDAYKQGTGHVS